MSPLVARNCGDAVLLGLAFAAGFGETRGENHGAARLSPRASGDGIDDDRFGHDQHHGIDAERQIVDVRHARRGR